MGARGRTNPERLPRGGGAELKWKQRAGAVWEATKTKAAAEGPPPPPVSHPRSWNHTPTPTAVSGWRSRSPHREVGPGTRSGLISPGAAVALGSPSRAHHQPALLRALTVAGQAGITPNPQETAQRLALLRPAVGAAPDTLRENSHTCLRLQGSQFRTALRCPQAGGPQRLERATHNGDGAAIGVWGLALEVPRPGEIHPTPGSPTPLSCLTLGVQSKRGGAEREPLNARPSMPPA